MKDEIKEILDKVKEISNYGADGKQHTRMFNQFEAKALLDYITNSQDRIKELETINEEHRKLNGELRKENQILRENAEHNDKVVDKARWDEMIYKTRNEKAVEYMNNYNELVVPNANIKSLILKEEYKKIIDILQGSDE